MYNHREYMRKWRKTEKGKLSRRTQRLKIKISLEELNSIRIKQNNLCAICNQKEIIKDNRDLAIDHCHKTNKIRGLLCSKCNRGIGCFNDNIKLLKNAIRYLQK